MILVVLVLTVGGTLLVSLLSPKSYVATAVVVVDVKYADPIAGSILPALTQPSYMATQLDIIQSDRVASKVVTKLKLDENPNVRESWIENTGGKGTLQAWLTSGVRGNLEVKPSRDSNVVEIKFKARDPRVAAEVANAIAQAYIDTSVELRVGPAKMYTTYFDEQAQIARDRLEHTQTALSTFQRDHGVIVASDQRFDLENSRLAELSTQLSTIQGQKADLQSRQSQARVGADSLQEVLQSPLIQGLKGDVARMEARVQEMSGNLGANNPQLLRARLELASMRGKLSAETQQIANGVASSNRMNAQREADIKGAIDAQKQQLLKLKEGRDAAAVLQRDVDAAQRAYDAIASRQTQSNLESRITQTNIAVLSPAVEPISASSPKILLNVAVSLVAGLLLGAGLALLIEQPVRRVRTLDDLTALIGLPVLGALAGGRDDRLVARLAAPRKSMPRLAFGGDAP